MSLCKNTRKRIKIREGGKENENSDMSAVSSNEIEGKPFSTVFILIPQNKCSRKIPNFSNAKISTLNFFSFSHCIDDVKRTFQGSCQNP